MAYKEQTFSIPELKGISKKNIEEHLKLYSGYVKNSNLILDKITEYGKEAEKNAYVLAELQRRFSFEFNGMRNHEYYFKQFEGGPKPLKDARDSSGISSVSLRQAIERDWGNFDAWLLRFKAVAMTRGIGWAMLYFDPETNQLTHAWVDEQHLGQLNGLQVVLALDMWEHSFVADYQPSGRKNYLEDFFANLNWDVVENNFIKANKIK